MASTLKDNSRTLSTFGNKSTNTGFYQTGSRTVESEAKSNNLKDFLEGIKSTTVFFKDKQMQKGKRDIYINLDTIQTNAIQYKQSLEKELKLVLIHSILHLIGFTDDTPEAFNKMTDKQTMLLQLLP